MGPKKLQLSATVSPSEVELKTKSGEEDARKKMLSVIEKVEGASVSLKTIIRFLEGIAKKCLFNCRTL